MKNVEKIKKIVDDLGVIKASQALSISPIELSQQLDLNLKTIDDIDFKPFQGGVVGSIMFDNGYGVSVVSHKYSYGGEKGLYEMAILDSDGNLTYDTDITSDVLGYLTPKAVTEYMIRVQDLKS
jgi:hypothetical protein